MMKRFVLFSQGKYLNLRSFSGHGPGIRFDIDTCTDLNQAYLWTISEVRKFKDRLIKDYTMIEAREERKIILIHKGTDND